MFRALTPQQAQAVADIESLHAIPGLYARICMEFGFTVTVPSGFDRDSILDATIDMVSSLGSYASMHESVKRVHRRTGAEEDLVLGQDLSDGPEQTFLSGSFGTGVLGTTMTRGLKDMIKEALQGKGTGRPLRLLMLDFWPRFVQLSSCSPDSVVIHLHMFRHMYRDMCRCPCVGLLVGTDTCCSMNMPCRMATKCAKLCDDDEADPDYPQINIKTFSEAMPAGLREAFGGILYAHYRRFKVSVVKGVGK